MPIVTPEAESGAVAAYLADLLDSVRETVIEVDNEYKVRFCNDAYLKSTGMRRESVVGKRVFDFFPAFRQSIFYEAAEVCRKAGHPAAAIGFSTLNNRWMLLRAFPTEGGLVVLANDASDSLLKQYQLSQEAVLDSLTLLRNKLALIQDIEALVEQGVEFSLAAIGLSRFKIVNDREGFSGGDRVLMEMAARLKVATLEGEALFRLNSDVFVLLLRRASVDSVLARTRSLMTQALLPIQLNGHDFVLGAAAGIVHAPGVGRGAEAIVGHAVMALRRAKRSSQDNIATYDQALESDGALTAVPLETSLEVDSKWLAINCNDAFLAGTGLARDKVIGKSPFEFVERFSRTAFFASQQACLLTRRATSAVGFSTMLGRWIVSRNFPLDHGGMLLLASDASEEQIEGFKRANLGEIDELTRLPNERALAQDIEMRCAAAERFSLLLLGLNRLKVVNEIGGMAEGDRVLIEMASRLLSAVAPGDRVFRLHSDLFPVLMRDDEATFATRLQILDECVSRPIAILGRELVLGARGGLASAPGDGGDADLLTKRAVLALKKAKRGGHVKVVPYDPSLETDSDSRVALESELRGALAAGQMVLYLQPKGSLRDNGIVGAEALVRWQHPAMGLVPPGRFLPLAQECGLMLEIDRWVITSAMGLLNDLGSKGIDVPLSINLSVESLSDAGLVSYVRESLERTGVEPRMLDIEIPEGTLMLDVQTSEEVLTGLAAIGVSISIDDFGTGYSSFAYLARFPVGTLKIDRSFISGMMRADIGRNVVAGLIALSHGLKLRVVAEGAETREQIALLARMGCDEVQGYGYSHPLPYDDFCRFASANRPVAS